MAGVVVLGARNLGGVILERFGADGRRTAGIARSEETATAIRARGALAFQADATDPTQLAAVLERAAEALGGIDVIVNAMSVAAPAAGEPWGGGALVDANASAWERWSAAIGHMAFVFLGEGARALRAGGRGGVLIQVTNGTARRSVPGQGPLSAGHQSLRALTRAAAEELRPEGIRACLLVADGPVWSPKTADRIRADGLGEDDALGQEAIADAVAFLAGQTPRGLTYELVLRPAGLACMP